MSNYLLRRAESMYHSKVIQNKLEDLSQQASEEANAGPNFSSLEPALWEVVSEIMAKLEPLIDKSSHLYDIILIMRCIFWRIKAEASSLLLHCSAPILVLLGDPKFLC